MEIVLNATLAGGIAAASAPDIIIMPGGSMIAGFITGCVSALGYAYLSSFLQRKIKLHDTCGVLNLHGLPGLIGAIIAAIVASRGDTSFEGNFSLIFKVTGRTANQ